MNRLARAGGRAAAAASRRGRGGGAHQTKTIRTAPLVEPATEPYSLFVPLKKGHIGSKPDGA